MSPFFHPHQPYDEVTLDDICSYFPSPRYPIDRESNFDTRLTPIVSLDSDPSEPSYSSYRVEPDPSEPSYPSVIRLTSDSSTSSAVPRHISSPICGHRFICTSVVPQGHRRAQGGGCSMMAPVALGMVTSHLMVDLDSACRAEHEDSPFWL